MDACAFDVFHDSRNEDVLSVTDCIDFKFNTHFVLVDEDRIFNSLGKNDLHVFLDVVIVEGNDHVLAAENV